MYKKHLNVKEGVASCSEHSSFAYAYIILTLHSKKRLVLVCIYRKQEVPFTHFYDEIASFLEKMVFKGDALMLVGDFNLWVELEDDTNVNKLLTLMSAHGLNQRVLEHTEKVIRLIRSM